MLSQVLGWRLLSSPSAVQQFSLQQWQVSLEKKKQGLEGTFPSVGLYTTGLATSKGFTNQMTQDKSPFLLVSLIFKRLSMNKVTSIILNLSYWLTCLLPPQDVNPLREETAFYLPLWPSRESKLTVGLLNIIIQKLKTFLKTSVRELVLPTWEYEEFILSSIITSPGFCLLNPNLSLIASLHVIYESCQGILEIVIIPAWLEHGVLKKVLGMMIMKATSLRLGSEDSQVTQGHALFLQCGTLVGHISLFCKRTVNYLLIIFPSPQTQKNSKGDKSYKKCYPSLNLTIVPSHIKCTFPIFPFIKKKVRIIFFSQNLKIIQPEPIIEVFIPQETDEQVKGEF